MIQVIIDRCLLRHPPCNLLVFFTAASRCSNCHAQELGGHGQYLLVCHTWKNLIPDHIDQSLVSSGGHRRNNEITTSRLSDQATHDGMNGNFGG
ncbi:hypothetical protein D3C84_850400 [compost metagenome]